MNIDTPRIAIHGIRQSFGGFMSDGYSTSFFTWAITNAVELKPLA